MLVVASPRPEIQDSLESQLDGFLAAVVVEITSSAFATQWTISRGLYALLGLFPEAHRPVDANPGYVLEHRVERDRIAMEVRDQGDAHPGTLSRAAHHHARCPELSSYGFGGAGFHGSVPESLPTARTPRRQRKCAGTSRRNRRPPGTARAVESHGRTSGLWVVERPP